MSSEATITHDFDRLLAQYPGFFKELLAYVDDIRQYGTLKQAINDTNLKLDKLRTEAAELQAHNATLVGDLEAQYAAKNADLDTAFKARLEEIANLMTAAKLDAENIRQSGERAKDGLLSEARAMADVAEQRAKDARLQAETHEATIAGKQATLADLEAQIRDRQGDLDRITQSIADLKAKLG